MILLHLGVHEGSTPSRLGHVIRERRDGPEASTVIAFWVVESEVWGVAEVKVFVKAVVLGGSKTMAPEEQEEEKEYKETGYTSYDTAYDLV